MGLVALANRAGITIADQIANEHATGRQFDRRHFRRGADASESCVDEREEPTPLVLPEDGHRVLAHEVADRDRLAVVVPAQFLLAVKRDILQHHAVDPELGGNPRVEAADADILDEARAEVVGVAHIQSDHALAIARADVDVAEAAHVAGVETYPDGPGVSASGVPCTIADLVAEPLRWSASRPDHFLGLCRIVETGAMVLEFEDRPVTALALQHRQTLIGAPLKRAAEEVGAVGQIDDGSPGRIVAQRLLNGPGVVGHAVALGVVRRGRHVDNARVGGEDDVLGAGNRRPWRIRPALDQRTDHRFDIGGNRVFIACTACKEADLGQPRSFALPVAQAVQANKACLDRLLERDELPFVPIIARGLLENGRSQRRVLRVVQRCRDFNVLEARSGPIGFVVVPDAETADRAWLAEVEGEGWRRFLLVFNGARAPHRAAFHASVTECVAAMYPDSAARWRFAQSGTIQQVLHGL